MCNMNNFSVCWLGSSFKSHSSLTVFQECKMPVSISIILIKEVELEKNNIRMAEKKWATKYNRK